MWGEEVEQECYKFFFNYILKNCFLKKGFLGIFGGFL